MYSDDCLPTVFLFVWTVFTRSRRVAIFRCTNDETAVMLVYQKSYVGIEPFSNVETLIFF